MKEKEEKALNKTDAHLQIGTAEDLEIVMHIPSHMILKLSEINLAIYDVREAFYLLATQSQKVITSIEVST